MLATSVRVRVPAGLYQGALLFREIDDGADVDPPSEGDGKLPHVAGAWQLRWVAPGLGTVRTAERGGRTVLMAASLDGLPLGGAPAQD